MLLPILAISVGASCGAVLRWLLGSALNQHWHVLPLGTLTANLLGGFLVGVAVPWLAQHSHLAPEWRLLIITGFLGGLTTFSTFSAEVIEMLLEQKYSHAAATAALHLIGALLLTGLGFMLARFFMPPTAGAG
ncbi:fluoride efflux transporter CrcB [Alishewanella sp. 16-MA]|uniref:Fluoride-specific ion channel FluC n=1 Tax=Alishewanella maricola TaxID=2795740 RepID=A0ABS8C6R8_9ALTE|nr:MULTISPECIES: fluoride efflux transporter CrcB [Alishewanella]MDP4945988.1 fluoride efflux transporter CrcB [Alishewanella sp.]MCB5228033.1 fluoride efflux transporter CrcB [Alishewanella maricola]MDP5034484.1 fluoride efflux transporter CrcB [Alishewanella sp.]MDP5187916.1 fluoride efflux transporter CrcB [Alishewanella sp.]MDP5460413.1 fluoride efflux transporter CrcB [Alishewanella sp. SMS8]